MTVYLAYIHMDVRLRYNGNQYNYLAPEYVTSSIEILDKTFETQAQANSWKNSLLSSDAKSGMAPNAWLSIYAGALFNQKIPKDNTSLVAIYQYQYQLISAQTNSNKLIIRKVELVPTSQESTNIPKKVLLSTGTRFNDTREKLLSSILDDVNNTTNINYPKFMTLKLLNKFLPSKPSDPLLSNIELQAAIDAAVDELRNCSALVIVGDKYWDEIDLRLLQYAQSSNIPVFVMTTQISPLPTSLYYIIKPNSYYNIYSLQELMYEIYYNHNKKQIVDTSRDPMWIMTIAWRHAMIEYPVESTVNQDLLFWLKEYLGLNLKASYSTIMTVLDDRVKNDEAASNAMLLAAPDHFRTELNDLITARRITYRTYMIPYRTYNTFEEAYDEYKATKQSGTVSTIISVVEQYLFEKYTIRVKVDQEVIDVVFGRSYTANDSDPTLKPIYNQTKDLFPNTEHLKKQIYIATIQTTKPEEYIEPIVKYLVSYGYDVIMPIVYNNKYFNRKTNKPTEEMDVKYNIRQYSNHILEFVDGLLIPNDSILDNTELTEQTFLEVLHTKNNNTNNAKIISYKPITHTNNIWENKIRSMVTTTLNGTIYNILTEIPL